MKPMLMGNHVIVSETAKEPESQKKRSSLKSGSYLNKN